MARFQLCTKITGASQRISVSWCFEKFVVLVVLSLHFIVRCAFPKHAHCVLLELA